MIAPVTGVPTPAKLLGAATNTETVAHVGLGLLATSTGALGKLILAGATCGGHVAGVPLALAFAGIVIGGGLAYLGRPATAR